LISVAGDCPHDSAFAQFLFQWYPTRWSYSGGMTMRHVIFAIVLGAACSAVPVAANNETARITAAQADDPDQKIRCRKVEVTGSMVKKGRVCKTIAEWKTIISNGNENARALVIDGTTRPAGN
jgi:hypothetical protein